ncbi:MAG: YbbR-like domain-containing protein, partial [Treponema sp.]|nr:YbbR-like domain-containing protein [Treponema sp.]
SDNISALLDLSWITQEGSYEVPISIDLPSNIVEMNPLQVTVFPEKIKVRLERNTIRAVKILPQTSGKLADGYAIESLSCEPEYVSIYGPRSIIQNIESIATEGVPIDDKTQSFSQKVRLANINKMIKIYGEEETLATVKVDYEDGIKEFKALPILLRNLSAGFECDTQKKASITLRGPRLIMNDWTPNPDTLSVDLREITEAGDYTLPVSVLIPQEFHLESVSVDNIDVKIKERPPAEVVDETESRQGADHKPDQESAQ